jgi:DHA3 family macrolide efflux protein-like MFS transporter
MEGAVIIDGISFLISALLIRTCSIREEVRLPNGRMKWRDIGIRMAFADFREGLNYILQNRLLIAILSGFFIFGLINGGFAVLPIFSMKYKLASDDFEKFASLFAVFLGIGFLAGSAVGSVLIKAVKPYLIMISGIGAASLLTFAMGYTSHVWLYLVLVFVAGLVIAPVNIAIGGWMPAIVDPGKMGRVSAWIDPLMMLAQSIALGLIALLYPLFIHLEMLYYGMGIGLFLIFLIYAMVLPRLSKQSAVVIPGIV